MSQKLFKKLRKLSKDLAKANGYPDVAYITGTKSKTLGLTGHDEHGNPTYGAIEVTGTDRVSPKSARGIYLTLKKEKNKEY